MSARVISSSSPTSFGLGGHCLPVKGFSGRRGSSRRAPSRRPCGSRSGRRQQVRAPWTSTPCRRRPLRRGRRRARLVDHPDRPDAGRAHLVHSLPGDLLGKPPLICAWREGPDPGRPGGPGRRPRAAPRRALPPRAPARPRWPCLPARWRRAREASAQLAERRARGSEDHGLGHGPRALPIACPASCL